MEYWGDLGNSLIRYDLSIGGECFEGGFSFLGIFKCPVNLQSCCKGLPSRILVI